MSDEIFVVGNSWSAPCDEAPIPVFDILGLKKRWEIPGITLDAQAEYIIDEGLTSRFKVIWLVGHQISEKFKVTNSTNDIIEFEII